MSEVGLLAEGQVPEVKRSVVVFGEHADAWGRGHLAAEGLGTSFFFYLVSLKTGICRHLRKVGLPGKMPQCGMTYHAEELVGQARAGERVVN